MNTEKKEKKPPKPASIYRKPIAEKTFLKRYLGLVEQEKDRALLESSFELVEGRYTLKNGLDRATMVRLNKLAKAIKGNRGFLNTGPGVVILLLAAAVAVFVLFFMNPVLERSIERALEGTFGAAADVDRFRFRPSRLEISIARITVADREKPMTNLFETSRIALRINPGALIRGRVYIEEASAASIALGTPRKVSGALKGTPAPAAPVSTTPPATDLSLEAISSLIDLENFDATALLEREKEKLRTTAAYADAIAAYEAAVKRWETRIAESKESVKELGALSKKVLAINPKNFRKVEEVKAAIAEAQTVADTAKTTAEEAKAIVEGAKDDAEAAAALVKKARAAVAEDLAYLKSFIDPKSGVAKGILEPVIWAILDDKVDRYIYYGRRGLEVAEKLKTAAEPSAEKKEEKKKFAEASRGRDVIFPSAALPRFRLGLLASSFTAGDQDWKVELREVSSNPDLVPVPTTLQVAMERGSVRSEADVVADFRSGSAEAFSVDVKGTRLPVDLGDALEVIGLGGFTGRIDAGLDLRGTKTGDVSASAEMDVKEAAAADPKGVFGTAVSDALASVDAVELDIAYLKSKGEDADFSVDTNLDKLVAKAITDLATRYAKKAVADLERALKAYVSAELEGKLSTDQLDMLLGVAKGDDAAAASLKKLVEDKKAALEAQAQSIVDQARAAAEKAAADAAEKAKAEAQKAADAAKTEAQKAADDAKKRAEDAAKKAGSKIEKPKLDF